MKIAMEMDNPEKRNKLLNPVYFQFTFLLFFRKTTKDNELIFFERKYGCFLFTYTHEKNWTKLKCLKKFSFSVSFFFMEHERKNEKQKVVTGVHIIDFWYWNVARVMGTIRMTYEKQLWEMKNLNQAPSNRNSFS